MRYPVTTLSLLVLFFQRSSSNTTKGNSPSTNGRSHSRDFHRMVGILSTRTGNSIWSLLNLEDGPVQARIGQTVYNLVVPFISKPDFQTVKQLQEKVGNDVEGKTDHETAELLRRDGNFNNVPSTNSNEINKRLLSILRLDKGLENPGIGAMDDQIKHYLIQHGHTFVTGSPRLETDDGSVKEAQYSDDTKEKKRDLSLLRVGKRQLPMLRLDKRQLPMLRLGKRQLPMLRLGKRQLAMLRLGKRQLAMLRLGKRQLPMLRLGKRQLAMLRLGKRQLPMLRLGKRQLPMLRLGKRQLPMLRLGKRQLPMLRLDKRQLPMLRLGKRQLPMLRLGKRQLAMLRLGKRLNYGGGETEKQTLDMLSFDTPESEMLTFDTPQSEMLTFDTPDSKLFRFDSPESRLSRKLNFS